MSKYNILKALRDAKGFIAAGVGAAIMMHAGAGLAHADEAKPAKVSRTVGTILALASDPANFDPMTVHRNEKGQMCVDGHFDGYKTEGKLVNGRAMVVITPDGAPVDSFVMTKGVIADAGEDGMVKNKFEAKGAKAKDLAISDTENISMSKNIGDLSSILKGADEDPRFQPVKAELGSAKLAVDVEKKPVAGKQKFKVNPKGMVPGS